jgi:hypothetical protein
MAGDATPDDDVPTDGRDDVMDRRQQELAARLGSGWRGGRGRTPSTPAADDGWLSEIGSATTDGPPLAAGAGPTGAEARPGDDRAQARRLAEDAERLARVATAVARVPADHAMPTAWVVRAVAQVEHLLATAPAAGDR